MKLKLWVVLFLVGIPTSGNPLKVPEFVESTPKEHFIGIGAPCHTHSEARKSAIDDVAKQVLGSIGRSYNHMFTRSNKGDPHRPKFYFSDHLSSTTHGIVLDIERNIVKSYWSSKGSDKYVCFILVRYTDKLISEMRRLSKGPHLVASAVSENQNSVRLKVSEVNGVSVILTSADIHLAKKNRFADVISFFVIKVSKGSNVSYSVAFDPVPLCGNSGNFEISLSRFCNKGLSDYLLGAQVTKSVVLKGYDELSRPVSVNVEF